MNSQKRLLLFVALSFVMMWATQALLERAGWIPKPAPPGPAVVANDPNRPAVAQADAEKKPGEPAAPAAVRPADAEPPRPRKPEPPRAAPGELVLGAAEDTDPTSYHLKVEFDQLGAGVFRLSAARFDAETPEGLPDRKARLQLIQSEAGRSPSSFSMTLRPDGAAIEGAIPAGEVPLDTVLWEVVRDKPGGPAVRPITKTAPEGSGQVEGQEIAFRTAVENPGVSVTRTYRIYKGEDGFETDVTFSSDKDATVSYRLFGPHGIPIEGEWYTSVFRDVFFGQIKGSKTEVSTWSASDVVKRQSNPEVFQTLPLKYTGVENQYFAVLLEPVAREARITSTATFFVAKEDPKATQKSDVGVEVTSQPKLAVRPGQPLTHTYRIFAGPKTYAALLPYEATELAGYRKNWLPLAPDLAQYVITPLLDRIYGLTTQVARSVGLKNGNYGISIILLTVVVRLCLFPLGRKQAMISKKMQDLQPQLALIKEKYKDDKERTTKETLALYRDNKFNPAAGCLPALIQMPIFMGLWQALNNSVGLRHSPFLYIKNLAAPDMMFSFGTDLPFIGRYFNLLPIISVGLFMLQTKMFTPPPATEEAKMQQSVMKYMLIFMGFMFYRVPSGLSLYFITSNLWSMGERLILPKLARRKEEARALAAAADPDFGKGGDGGGGKGALNLPPAPKPAGGANGWLSRKLEKLLEEAEAQRTIRNNPNAKPNPGNGNGNGNGSGPDRNRNRPRPGKRR